MVSAVVGAAMGSWRGRRQLIRGRQRACVAICAVFLALCMRTLCAESTPRRYDVVVYAATASGAVAAIAAAEEGMRVALLEPGRHVGGVVSGGLGRTDYGNQSVIGGLALEFFERVGKHYNQPVTWFFEPHVAETVFTEWLREAGVDIFFEHRVDSIQKEGTRIVSLKTNNGALFAASVFIDASYEGDLLPRAGVSYRVGREGREEFGESFGGRLEISAWPVQFPPISANDEQGKLLPLIYGGDPGRPGDADFKVQTYNFRLCLTHRKDNQVPFPRPPHYNPRRYELLKRDLALRGRDFNLHSLMIMSSLPNDKVDVNHGASVSTCYIGANWEYPEADYRRRQEIWEDHKHYTQGFLYFLAHDPSVPKHIQDEINQWGLCRDEFVDTEHWPHQLYIREARRMVGAYFMTEHDLKTSRTKFDSIGMGSYSIDSHHVQRFVSPDGTVVNEGNTNYPVRPYEIPYRALLPRPQECENLLVTVSMSGTHAAYSSIRMEPQYMIMGHSAGVASAMAVKDSVRVQEVDIRKLQHRLKEQKQVLSFPDPPPIYSVAPRRFLGFVADNADALITGNWTKSNLPSPFIGDDDVHFVGDDYLVAGPWEGKAVRFIPGLLFSGKYEIRIAYTPDPERATNALLTVHTADGDVRITLNQKSHPGKSLPFRSLGTYRFSKSDAWVEISSTAADGTVVADAVQWLPRY